jgi:hypothetical protein
MRCGRLEGVVRGGDGGAGAECEGEQEFGDVEETTIQKFHVALPPRLGSLAAWIRKNGIR